MRGCLQVVVNLRAKKRLVSRVVGVGVHRVRFDSDHLDDIADAITRDSIRSLLTANTITIKKIVGTSRGRAQLKRIQKKKRGTKQGSKKGRKGARIGKNGFMYSKFVRYVIDLKLQKTGKKLQILSFGHFTK